MSKLDLDNNRCLSLDVMRMYQERKLADKDMHHVEKHLLDCELCSDVMDGLEVHDIPVIRSIAANVNSKIGMMVGPAPAPSFLSRFKWYFAAPLVLLLGWFAWKGFSGDAPSKVTPPVAPQQPVTGNNGPQPVKEETPQGNTPERNPQGVEKQLPSQPLAENKKTAEDPGKNTKQEAAPNTIAKTGQEETVLNTNTNSTEKKDETGTPNKDESPGPVKTPPVIDYSNLRILEVKVINKVTATSGSSRKSGSSNGQLGSKSDRSDDGIFMPDEMPVFYGGDDAMKSWLALNFKNPVKDKRDLKGMTTSVIFKVSSKGKISDVTVGKSLLPELDAELVRLVESMPQWKAATKKGTIQCILSITFK